MPTALALDTRHIIHKSFRKTGPLSLLPLLTKRVKGPVVPCWSAIVQPLPLTHPCQVIMSLEPEIMMVRSIRIAEFGHSVPVSASLVGPRQWKAPEQSLEASAPSRSSRPFPNSLFLLFQGIAAASSSGLQSNPQLSISVSAEAHTTHQVQSRRQTSDNRSPPLAADSGVLPDSHAPQDRTAMLKDFQDASTQPAQPTGFLPSPVAACNSQDTKEAQLLTAHGAAPSPHPPEAACEKQPTFSTALPLVIPNQPTSEATAVSFTAHDSHIAFLDDVELGFIDNAAATAAVNCETDCNSPVVQTVPHLEGPIPDSSAWKPASSAQVSPVGCPDTMRPCHSNSWNSVPQNGCGGSAPKTAGCENVEPLLSGRSTCRMQLVTPPPLLLDAAQVQAAPGGLQTSQSTTATAPTTLMHADQTTLQALSVPCKAPCSTSANQPASEPKLMLNAASTSEFAADVEKNTAPAAPEPLAQQAVNVHSNTSPAISTPDLEPHFTAPRLAHCNHATHAYEHVAATAATEPAAVSRTHLYDIASQDVRATVAAAVSPYVSSDGENQRAATTPSFRPARSPAAQPQPDPHSYTSAQFNDHNGYCTTERLRDRQSDGGMWHDKNNTGGTNQPDQLGTPAIVAVGALPGNVSVNAALANAIMCTTDERVLSPMDGGCKSRTPSYKRPGLRATRSTKVRRTGIRTAAIHSPQPPLRDSSPVATHCYNECNSEASMDTSTQAQEDMVPDHDAPQTPAIASTTEQPFNMIASILSSMPYRMHGMKRARQ